MIEINHTLLAPDTLDNLIIEVITRQATDYGDDEMAITNKKNQLPGKLVRGEAFIVYSEEEGFCNIVSREDKLAIQALQQFEEKL